jgi:hypothetical protein
MKKKFSKVPDAEKYGYCECEGCNNALSEHDVEVVHGYCPECFAHIITIEEGSDKGTYYCSLHGKSPTKEEMEEDKRLFERMDRGYLIATKAYKKKNRTEKKSTEQDRTE